MIGPLITENPFGLPGLHWREGRFAVTSASALTLGPVTVTLPDALRHAAAKRKSEYLAGRLCAAYALRAAGLPEAVGTKDRAPVWPIGAVGSISHSDARAVAVVSRDLAGLGVDIEPLLTPAQALDIQDMILTKAEADMQPPDLTFPEFLTLLFSAKEALYKALSARLLQMPAFLDVVLVEMTPATLTLRLGADTVTAHFILSNTDVTTLVAMDASAKGGSAQP